VVLPLFSFDQFLNASRVAALGLGVALVDGWPEERRAGDVVAHSLEATDRLAAAVLAVLEDAAAKEKASELAAEIDALPDVGVCVASLSALKG
jgi:UDP:flavonoid glycosyltransferase YjiC (YdhE family)